MFRLTRQHWCRQHPSSAHRNTSDAFLVETSVRSPRQLFSKENAFAGLPAGGRQIGCRRGSLAVVLLVYVMFGGFVRVKISVGFAGAQQ